MLDTVAVENYRSLRRLVVPLRGCNVVTGPNGSGKSSLYRALRLLADSARNGSVNALAREGGLSSTMWAGPALRPSALLAERSGPAVLIRDADGGWRPAATLRPFDSMLSELADPLAAPELLALRERVRSAPGQWF